MASPSRPVSARSTSGSSSRSRRSAPSPTSRLTRSARTCSAGAWTRDGWIVPRSGLTCAPSTAAPGADWWTSYTAALRASRSALPASGGASATPATSSPTSSAWFESASPQASFWRMCLEACRTSSMSSCPSYRAWATELRRASSARRTSARRTSGSGSSFWPTKSAVPYGTNVGGAMGRVGRVRPSLETLAAQWTTPQAHDAAGGDPKRVKRHGTKHGDANLADDVTLWASPSAHDGRRPGSDATSTQGTNLKRDAEAWATPTSRDHKDVPTQTREDTAKHPTSSYLGLQAPRSGIGGPPSWPAGPSSPRLWQTPTVEDAGRSGSLENWQQYEKDHRTTQARLRNQIWQTPRTGVHGVPGEDKRHGGQPKGMRLNPLFVEWLMGLPLFWTELRAPRSRGGGTSATRAVTSAGCKTTPSKFSGSADTPPVSTDSGHSETASCQPAPPTPS